MELIDFIIGMTLVNGMPHLVLGIWKGRMLSGFGIGDTRNILYGIFNFGLSLSLFLYEYGWEAVLDNGIFIGGLFTIVMYILLGHFFYNRLHKRHYEGAATHPEI